MKTWIFGVAALAAAMCFGATTEDGVTKERRGALGPNDTVVTDVDTTGIVAARTYTKDEVDRRIATNAPVRSVNGKTGRVVLGANDVGALPNNRDGLKANANFRNAVWDVQIRGGGCDTNAVDALANSAVVTNALTVATTNRVALLESSKADKFALEAHVASTSNPHSVTAEQVNAYTKETVDAKLDEKADIVGGKIPASQLPSYVDDVLEYDTMSAFPVTGEVGKIYVAKDTNLTYRWSGTQYVEISPSPLLDDTVTEKSPNGVKSSGIWSWVKSLFPKWLTSDYAEPATVASVKLKADKATTLAGYGITDAVPFVNDVNDAKTAVTIGSHKYGELVGEYSFENGDGVTAAGNYSHAEGSGTTAAGNYSHAEGSVTTAAGNYSHAEGVETTAAGNFSHAEGARAYTKEQDSYAFAWNGDWERLEMYDPYESHGEGTFNINPAGGLNGFYIGEQTLAAILANKADKADISAENQTFSNAVLAVGLNIDTNSVAVLNDIAATFGGFPIEGTATTVGGLLAALAAAAAWLKKNKVQTLKLNDNSVETSADGGVAKLDDFFTNSNSLLTGTIDARLPYPLYAVPSTGLLKDRAINTTSLASVTVPDNFTDLLVRASVASSLAVTMPEAIATKYGDAFPGEAGEYLITITKTGAAEAYVRTIKLEEVANA